MKCPLWPKRSAYTVSRAPVTGRARRARVDLAQSLTRADGLEDLGAKAEFMDKRALYDFIRARKFAVMASVTSLRAPEAALVGYALTPEFELVFDTTDATRKCANLRANPNIAFVIGWDGSETVQYEGIADEPAGAERERLKKIYFEAFPDGVSRQEWPGLTYFRVKPRWIRFSSYYRPRSITEFSF